MTEAILLFLTAVIGVAIGSFLNMASYRLPLMLQKQWQSQCESLLNISPQQEIAKEKSFNLFSPPSHCPHCQHALRIYENVPLFSYIFLKGRCSHCHKRISIQYPLVEIICALMSVAVAWHFGMHWATMFALIFTWALLCACVIDLHHQLLPDIIIIPLLWLGMFASLFGLFVNPYSAIMGAIAGYVSLWIIFWIFKFLTHKEGMGYGDFKLLACLGAWLGWELLPLIIFFSAFIGAATGILLMIFRKHRREMPIPFGPFLAGAGWFAFLWGQDVLSWYLQSFTFRPNL